MELSILKKDVPELGFYKGDIHEIFPQEKIIRANCEMLFKGVFPGIEFNKELYKKYFTRYVASGKSFVKDNDPSLPSYKLNEQYSKKQYANISKLYIKSGQNQGVGFKFIDRPKFESPKDLKVEDLIKDIQDNFPVIQHPYHTDEFWKFWNWGVSELSEIFIIIKIPDECFRGIDYRTLMMDSKADRKRDHFLDFGKKGNLELDKKMSHLWNEKKNGRFKDFCFNNFEKHKHENIEDYLKQNRYFPARYDLEFDLSIIEEK